MALDTGTTLPTGAACVTFSDEHCWERPAQQQNMLSLTSMGIFAKRDHS